jgi:hypothetical protein
MLDRLMEQGGESVSPRAFALHFVGEGNVHWAEDMVSRLIRAGYARVVAVGDEDSEARIGWMVVTMAGIKRWGYLQAQERKMLARGATGPQATGTGALSGRKGHSDGA